MVDQSSTMQKRYYYIPRNFIAKRARTTTSGRTVRGGPVGTAMSSPSSSPELPRLRFTFTFSEEERHWLLIALENEIFNHTPSDVYSMSRFFIQGTKKLQRLYDKMKTKKDEGRQNDNKKNKVC